MPTWPTTPVPQSVDDVMPNVPIATFTPDQPGYEIRRRPGSTIRSGFVLTYGNLSGNNRNILRHFISNEINFGATVFDWTMPLRNAMTISDITTATVTTSSPHYFTKGQWVTVSHTVSADGNYRVASTANNTSLVLTGLSDTESTGLIRPHLPNALIVLEQGRIPGYDKLMGPIADNYGLWNWSIAIQGVDS